MFDYIGRCYMGLKSVSIFSVRFCNNRTDSQVYSQMIARLPKTTHTADHDLIDTMFHSATLINQNPGRIRINMLYQHSNIAVLPFLKIQLVSN